MKVPTKLTLCAAALSVAVAIGAPTASMAKVEGPSVFWKMSLWGKPRAFTKGVEVLSKRLAEETGGKFKLKIFYGSQLSKPKENLDGLRVNAFELTMACNFYHPGKTATLMVLSLPFLPMADFETAARVRHGLYKHPSVVKEIARWNGLIYTSSHIPQYEFMGRGEPPLKLEDWKGLRVRAGGGIGLAMEKLGAVRQTMPATEVYTAIQRGTVDAVSFPFSYAHAAYKVDEVAKWYTANLSPGTADCPIIFNSKAYAKLPKQYQDLLWSLRDEVTAAYQKVYAAADQKYVPRFKKALTEIKYDDATLSTFRKIAGRPIWDAWVNDNKGRFDAQAVLDLVLKLAVSK